MQKIIIEKITNMKQRPPIGTRFKDAKEEKSIAKVAKLKKLSRHAYMYKTIMDDVEISLFRHSNGENLTE